MCRPYPKGSVEVAESTDGPTAHSRWRLFRRVVQLGQKVDKPGFPTNKGFDFVAGVRDGRIYYPDYVYDGTARVSVPMLNTALFRSALQPSVLHTP